MKWLNHFADKLLKTENEVLRSRVSKFEKEFSEPFMKGFSYGLEVALKLNPQISERVIKLSQDKAIEETLGRLNGHNKKNN